MISSFKKIQYSDLNSRQQENYNFHKLAAVLADYGFTSLRLTDDWNGADLVAQHIDGDTFLKIQLKGRLSFYKKYCGRDLYIAFPDSGNWYLYPHDELMELFLEETTIPDTKSWQVDGGYSIKGLTEVNQKRLEPYRIPE